MGCLGVLYRQLLMFGVCMCGTSGALQPATSRAMRLRATRAFHSTLANKINLPIIIFIIVIIVGVIVVVVIVCVTMIWQ